MGISSPLGLCLLYSALAVLLRLRFRQRWATLLLCLVLGVSGAVIWRYYEKWLYNARQLVVAWVVHRGPPRCEWPPQVGKPFPDLLLLDARGRLTRLSQFRGRVLLVELVATGSPASVAFAGGHAYGPFQSVAPQTNLKSLQDYLHQFGPVDLRDLRLVHVRLVIFNRNGLPPTVEDLQQWETHFRLEGFPNAITLAAKGPIVGPQNRDRVPGFYLVDRQFVVRAESCGVNPKHDFYGFVIPLLHELLNQKST